MNIKKIFLYAVTIIGFSILTACLGGCKSVFVELAFAHQSKPILANITQPPSPDIVAPPPARPEPPVIDPPPTPPPSINSLTNRRGDRTTQQSCCNRHLTNQLAPLSDYSFALFANNKHGEVQITPMRMENKQHIKIEIHQANSFAKINTYFFTKKAAAINIGEDINGNKLFHYNSLQGKNPPHHNMQLNLYKHQEQDNDYISVGLYLSRAFPISNRQTGIVSFKGAVHRFTPDMDLQQKIDFTNYKISDIQFNYNFGKALQSNKENLRHKINIHNLDNVKLGELDLNAELFNRFDRFNNIDAPSKFITSDETIVPNFNITNGGIYGREGNELFGAIGYDEKHVYTIVGDK